MRGGPPICVQDPRMTDEGKIPMMNGSQRRAWPDGIARRVLCLLVAGCLAVLGLAVAGCSGSKADDRSSESSQQSSQSSQQSSSDDSISMDSEKDGSSSRSSSSKGYSASNGSGYATLQDYFDDNPKAWESFESGLSSSAAGSSDYDVESSYKGNTITILCKLNQTMTQSQIEAAKDALDETMAESDPIMSTTLSMLESDTGVDGIEMVAKYVDANGNEIARYTFG